MRMFTPVRTALTTLGTPAVGRDSPSRLKPPIRPIATLTPIVPATVEALAPTAHQSIATLTPTALALIAMFVPTAGRTVAALAPTGRGA
jgi:hypothetical protein